MIDFKYRADIDGLRAVAVILVLLFHADLGFTGGYIGVDVFFVISGFLITGLILKELEAGKFTLTSFWLRRIRRIIPAATVVVIGTFVAGYFLLLPGDYADFGKSVVAQQLMLSNFYFWQNTGYFDGAADLKPLLHTWSLAVEEQFYVIYPFLLLLLTRFRPQVVFYGLLLAILASLAMSEYGVRYHPSASYFLLPTRAWELMIGGIVCLLPKPTRVPSLMREAVSWVALCVMLGAGWFYTPTTPFPGMNALAPCLATSLLIYLNSLEFSSVSTLLARKSVVFVGLISYSLYLWHWPILSYLRYYHGQDLSIISSILALLTTFALSILSWRFIETPIRNKEYFLLPRNVVTATITMLVINVALGIVIQMSGIRSRFSEEFLAIVETPYAGHEYGAKGNISEGWTLPVIGDRRAVGKPRFTLWGDSYAKCVSGTIHELALKYHIKGLDAGLGGVPPLLDTWTGTENFEKANSFNRYVVEQSRKEGVHWLIMFAAWDIHVDGMSKLRDQYGGSSFDAFKRGFEKTVAEAEKSGIKIAVLMQPPYQAEHVPKQIARMQMGGHDGMFHGVSITEHRVFQERSRQFFESFGNRIVLLNAEASCFDQETGLSIIGKNISPYYSDSGHPSRDGAEVFLRPTLELFFSSHFDDKAHNVSRN